MTKSTLYLVAIDIVSYFLGGLNGAIITSMNLFKKDVRHFGSGNAGLTNFTRTFGTGGTPMVVAVDVLKAVISIFFGGWLMGLAGYPEIGRLFRGDDNEQTNVVARAVPAPPKSTCTRC